MLRRLNATLRRMARDETGALTMEFAIWMPALILWMTFSLAVFNAYVARNQTAKATNTLSDIVSRKSEMGAAAFAELYDLQGRLMTTAREGRTLRITSVKFVRVDPDSDEREYEIRWSFASDTLQPLTAETFPFANLPLMAETDSAVYTEVSAPWSPIAGLTALSDHTWSFGVASRPRFVSSIELSAAE